VVVGDGTPGPGRDPIVATPEEFEAKANAYFAQCVADETRPTVLYNGYGEYVAGMYNGLDDKKERLFV